MTGIEILHKTIGELTHRLCEQEAHIVAQAAVIADLERQLAEAGKRPDPTPSGAQDMLADR